MAVKLANPKSLSILTNPETFSAERARSVNLVVLPTNIPGKKCNNCEYFDGKDNGYCSNEKVKMNVNGYWACSEWHNPTVIPVTSPDQLDELVKDGSTREEKSRMSLSGQAKRIQESISRFNSHDISWMIDEIDEYDVSDDIKTIAKEAVTRFSECGHTSEGEFDHGNTCGSLRGKSGKEHHEARVSHHEKRLANLQEHHKKLSEKMERIQAMMEKSHKRVEHHKKKAEEIHEDRSEKTEKDDGINPNEWYPDESNWGLPREKIIDIIKDRMKTYPGIKPGESSVDYGSRIIREKRVAAGGPERLPTSISRKKTKNNRPMTNKDMEEVRRGN